VHKLIDYNLAVNKGRSSHDFFVVATLAAEMIKRWADAHFFFVEQFASAVFFGIVPRVRRRV
jgi:hypothetical protein